MERLIRYLRGSFWVPLASRMAAEGVLVDAAAANLATARWLREVANARTHATIAKRYSGRKLPSLAAPGLPAARQPIVGL